MYRSKFAAKLLYRLVLLGSFFCWSMPSLAQSPSAIRQDFPSEALADTILPPAAFSRPADVFHSYSLLMPELLTGHYGISATSRGVLRFQRTAWSSSPGTIEKMESAFYCNDTPFVDQVRLPLATFWNGRVKLIGFESDVTTANFVLGLPGQGSLHSLSAFGNAFIATHTPPSDQLAGIHVTISLKPTGTDAGENSGRRGIEYLVRASRGFLPFWGARSESITYSAR